MVIFEERGRGGEKVQSALQLTYIFLRQEAPIRAIPHSPLSWCAVSCRELQLLHQLWPVLRAMPAASDPRKVDNASLKIWPTRPLWLASRSPSLLSWPN